MRVRTSAWWTGRSIMAAATTSSEKVSPQRPKGKLEVTITAPRGWWSNPLRFLWGRSSGLSNLKGAPKGTGMAHVTGGAPAGGSRIGHGRSRVR